MSTSFTYTARDNGDPAGSGTNTATIPPATVTLHTQANSAGIVRVAGKGTVTGVNGGFTNISGLTGGTGVDTFTFTALDSKLSGKIDGGAGLDRLVGGNSVNAWEVNASSAGTDNNTAFTQIENLTGGTRTTPPAPRI